MNKQIEEMARIIANANGNERDVAYYRPDATETETEIEFLLREGKRRNIIPMAKDITLKPQVKRYRKKPVIVEAYQTDKELIIHTLEGDMKANVGDYIITGVKGEQYPCKPDIFYATYEAVESEDKASEAAEEIFAEIERTLDNYHSACLPVGQIEAYVYYEGGLGEAIAELKKKHMEDK